MSELVRPPLMAHMAVLKPCPFCGSKWTQVRWIGFEDSLNSGYAPGYRGECTDCGAMTLPALSVEAAAEAWDRRANDARPVVLCRDCKHYSADSEMKCVHIFGLIEPDEDDFCSLGERREGGRRNEQQETRF